MQHNDWLVVPGRLLPVTESNPTPMKQSTVNQPQALSQMACIQINATTTYVTGGLTGNPAGFPIPTSVPIGEESYFVHFGTSKSTSAVRVGLHCG